MSQNSLIQYIQILKTSRAPSVPFFICVDDKIVHASQIVVKVLKQDITGTSFRTFLSGEDKEDALRKTEELYSGASSRTVRLGAQRIQISFESKRQKVDEKVVSFVLIKHVELLPDMKAS
jgi:hypothetical protein